MRKLLLFAFVGICAEIMTNPLTSAVEPTKQPLPDLPKAITSFGAARVESSLYIYGGHHGKAHEYSDEGQSGDLLRLDLEKPSGWEVVSKGPKLQGLALVAHRGKLYRVGGFTARNKPDEEHDLWSSSGFARFDPETKKWHELPAMPAPRSSFDATVVADTLFVVGGWAMQGDKETVWQDTAYAIDLSQSDLKWTELPKPDFERRALAVGPWNGKLYVIGGMQSNDKVTTQTAVYDPKTKKWSDGPGLPGEEMEGFGPACFPLGDRLFVNTSSGKLLRLNDDGSAWQITAELQIGRFFHRMLPIDEGHFAFLGGANMKRGRFVNVEVLDVKR
jgi:N-acetylneuraminic acid mutarotase